MTTIRNRSAERMYAAGLPPIWGGALGRAAIRSLQTLLVVFLAAVIIWAVTRVPLVIIPVLIALILASAINPLVHWLTRHHWPNALAVLASFVAILVVFGGVVTGVVFLIRSQSKDLVSKANDGIDRLHGFLTSGPYPISDAQLASARDSVQKFIANSSVGSEALSGLRTVADIAVGGVLMAVILFFFLKDGEKIRNFLFHFLPAGFEDKAHIAARRGTVVLGGYVRGTAMIALIDAVIVGIALVILHVPLALPLAVFVFIGGFIPIVGATAAGTLAVVVALLFNGPVAALIVLIVLVGANQFEHHILQPFLMGKVLHLHGLSILLALAAGTTLAGLIGALLAVPLTAVGWTIYKTWSGEDTPEAVDTGVAGGEEAAADQTNQATG